MPSEEVTPTEEPITEKPTTIKLPPSLKDELETLKEDDQETYASVISRLITSRSPVESTADTVTVALPRRLYQMMLMMLPGNISDALRKGVR